MLRLEDSCVHIAVNVILRGPPIYLVGSFSFVGIVKFSYTANRPYILVVLAHWHP